MKRTLLSKNTAWKPSLNTPPNLGSGPFGSYFTSSGLVHGTASAASTSATALEVPEMKLAGNRKTVFLPYGPVIPLYGGSQGVSSPTTAWVKVECGILVFTPKGA